MPPCIGLFSVWHPGCPPIPPPPPTIGPPPSPKPLKTCSLKDYLNAGFDFGFGLGLGVEAGLIKADVSWWKYAVTGLIMKLQFDFAKAEKWAADNGCDAIDW